MTRFNFTPYRRRLLFTAVVGCALTIGYSNPASAGLRCGPHDKIVATLKGKYKELRKGIGLVASQKVAEVYVSETGSWTFIVTHVNGVSCILAAGSSWEESSQVAAVVPDI